LNRNLAIVVIAVAISVSSAHAQDRSRRHAVHSGQHGGILLPIANDTLHVEGVFQEQRRFRVYVTHPSGQPLAPGELQSLRLQVADEAGRASPLIVSGDGQYLEARIATQPLPAALTIVVPPGDAEGERLGMLFTAYSAEPSSFDVAPTVIPHDLKGVLQAIRAQVQATIAMTQAGAFGQVYEPATHIRDLLLALRPYVRKLEGRRQGAADAAIMEAVRSSWLVHVSGDVGTPQQTSAAVEELRRAFNVLCRTFPDLVTSIS
jgi:hypothetical protein